MANFADAYVEWVRARSESPENFHNLAAVAMCCAALADRVYFDAPYGRVYPHLWLAFIGPSYVHKTAAVNHPSRLLLDALPGVTLPQVFSMEALIEHLADRQKWGLILWPEMGRAMESFSKDYSAGVISTLCEIWDSRAPISRSTMKGGQKVIRDPAVTILAAGKLKWLEQFISPRQVGGGWLGRWLFAVEQKDEGFRALYSENGWRPSEADAHVRDSLVAHLQELGQYEGAIKPGEGGLVLDDWRRDNEGRWSDADDPAEFSARAAENIIKITIGLQACRGVSWLTELHPKAVRQAITYWLYCFESGRRIVDGIMHRGKDADAIDAVLRVIKRQGTVTQRGVLRALRGMTKAELRPIAETLAAGGLISLEWGKPPPKGGPRSVIYRYTGDLPVEDDE